MSLKNSIIKPWEYCEKEVQSLIKDAEDHQIVCEVMIEYLIKFKNSEWTALEVLSNSEETDFTSNILENISLDQNLADQRLKEKLWNDFADIIFWKSRFRSFFISSIETTLLTTLFDWKFNSDNCLKAYEIFEKNALNLFAEQIQTIFNNLKKYSLNADEISDFKGEFHIPIVEKQSIESSIVIIMHELAGFSCIFDLYEDFQDGPTHMGYFVNGLVSSTNNKWGSFFAHCDTVYTAVDSDQTILKIKFSKAMIRAMNQFL